MLRRLVHWTLLTGAICPVVLGGLVAPSPHRDAVHARPAAATYPGRDDAAACKALGDSLQRHPESIPAWTDYIHCLYTLGSLDAYLSDPPASPWQHYAHGYALFLRQDVLNARRHLEEAVRGGVQHAISWNLLGTLRMESGALKAGREAYQTAVRLDPAYSPAVQNLRNLEAAMSDPAGLLSDIRRKAYRLDDAPRVLLLTERILREESSNTAERWVLAWLQMQGGQLAQGILSLLAGFLRGLEIYCGLLGGCLLGGMFWLRSRRRASGMGVLRDIVSLFGALLVFRVLFLSAVYHPALYLVRSYDDAYDIVFQIGHLLIMAAYSCLHVRRHPPKPALRTPGARTGMILECLVAWLLIVGLAFLQYKVAGILERPSWVREHSLVAQIHDAEDAATVWLGLFVSILLAPCCEEMFFRGVLLQQYLRLTASWKAALLVSCIFALYHQQFSVGLSVFYSSMIVCVLYQRHHSLPACILLHGLVNLSPHMAIFFSI